MWIETSFVVLALSFFVALGQELPTKMAAKETAREADEKAYWKNLTTSLLKPETQCQSGAFSVRSLVGLLPLLPSLSR